MRTATKFCLVLQLQTRRKILQVDHAPAMAEIFVTRILTRDLIAVVNLLV